MIVVFQGETGGYAEFSYGSTPAVSGYLFAVSQDRVVFRFDGMLASGNLLIAKSGLTNALAPGQYVALPQVIDADNHVYFLAPADIQIIEVPDFFSNAVLISTDSLLVRLYNLESISRGYDTFTAGPDGIQTAKIVAFVDGYVVHADARNIDHAGRAVGFSVESASAGDPVKIQTIGVFSSPMFVAPSTGPLFVGYNGSVAHAIQPDFTFVQFAGVAIDDHKLSIQIDTTALII